MSRLHSHQRSHFLNLGGILRHSAMRTPRKPAIISGKQIVTYEDLDQSTDALAVWFMRQGLEPGDRIAIHWCNSVDAVILLFACFKAGMIAVPLNNRLKSSEIAYILQHSKSKLCFSQHELAPLCKEAIEDCPDLQNMYTALPNLEPKKAASDTLPDIVPNRVAAILYTSGTTARPKGVMHTHLSLLAVAQLTSSLGLEESQTLLAATQMMHIAALGLVLLPSIYVGATVVLLPSFDASESLDLIERWNCSYIVILPAMLRFVVEEQARNPRVVSSLRICLAGGDTVPVTLQERFRALFKIPVQEIYGMTETVPVTCIRPDRTRTGSVGPALSMLETRVSNRDGKILADNEIGELQVLSPANCVGYWEDPLSTEATFDDGWLRTGDLVRRDAEGFFWFHGRAKQIIIRGGSNISSQEVEEALYHHPVVLEAGVVGAPDSVHGERVIAFVALRDGLTAHEDDLIEFVRSRIADYKTPEQIIFLPALPKGLTGKVQRRSLSRTDTRFPQHSAKRLLA